MNQLFKEKKDKDEDQSAIKSSSINLPTVPLSPSIRSFLTNLLEDADILPRTHRVDIGPFYLNISDEELLPGTHEKRIQDLRATFNEFYLARLTQELSEDLAEQYIDLLDQLDAVEDPNRNEQLTTEFDTFLDLYIPNFQEINAEIFFEFRHLYLDSVAEFRAKQSREETASRKSE